MAIPKQNCEAKNSYAYNSGCPSLRDFSLFFGNVALTANINKKKQISAARKSRGFQKPQNMHITSPLFAKLSGNIAAHGLNYIPYIS